MVGILINKKTWKVVVVLRRRLRKTDSNDSKRKGLFLACILGEILFKALLSPTIWLILSFLQKKFYVCAIYGPTTSTNNNQKTTAEPKNHECNITSKNPYSEAQLMAFSQMCALGLLITTTFAVLLVVLMAQCCKNRRNLHLPKTLFYKRIEAKAAAKEFHKMAKEQAQNRGKKAAEIVLESLSNDGDYLGVLSKAGAILDTEYGDYYAEIHPLIEHQRQHETCDQDHEPQSPGCVFEESAFLESYLAVDSTPHTVHFDSEVKVVHGSGNSSSRKARISPMAKSSIDIKNQYYFKRSYSAS